MVTFVYVKMDSGFFLKSSHTDNHLMDLPVPYVSDSGSGGSGSGSIRYLELFRAF